MAADFEELRIDELSRRFGSVSALSEISLSIRRGEFVALLGPSGCGKSTALNCLAGLLAASDGSIFLDDRRIDHLSPEKRGFGMVFQNYALFPHLSVRRNIGFGLKMRHVPAEEVKRRVDEAIRLVRLESQEHKLPGELSGGQQQRVAIARAIVIEPPVVLMDEPLSNLDAKLRIEMRSEIRRIHQALGSTTIYVTHDQEEALSLADRIVVMRDGRIRQCGSPTELYEAPLHVDVADFMGYRNRLRGIVSRVEGDRATVTVCGSSLRGRMMTPLATGATAIVAARTEDMLACEPQSGLLTVDVESTEYRGRGFLGAGRTSDGQEVVFHTRYPIEVGAHAALRANDDHLLVFAAENAA